MLRIIFALDSMRFYFLRNNFNRSKTFCKTIFRIFRARINISLIWKRETNGRINFNPPMQFFLWKMSHTIQKWRNSLFLSIRGTLSLSHELENDKIKRMKLKCPEELFINPKTDGPEKNKLSAVPGRPSAGPSWSNMVQGYFFCSLEPFLLVKGSILVHNLT